MVSAGTVASGSLPQLRLSRSGRPETSATPVSRGLKSQISDEMGEFRDCVSANRVTSPTLIRHSEHARTIRRNLPSGFRVHSQINARVARLSATKLFSNGGRTTVPQEACLEGGRGGGLDPPCVTSRETKSDPSNSRKSALHRRRPRVSSRSIAEA